jgi:multimeric flavodoxin WrbA
MKIMAVSGSPRRGNSEWMLSQLADHLEAAGASVEVIRLRQLSIKHCVGCLKCEDRRGICQLKDDMNELLPRLVDSEAIVMASPVYFEMICGGLKNFIDRTCPVWTQLNGKALAGLLVAEEGIGQSVRNLQQYARVCKMNWSGAVTLLAKNPGEAENIPELQPKLQCLAGRIMRTVKNKPAGD